MAIVNCPECDKPVSDTAAACPICGFQVERHFSLIRQEEMKKKHQREQEHDRQLEYKKKLEQVEEPKRPQIGNEIAIAIASLISGIFFFSLDDFGIFIGLVFFIAFIYYLFLINRAYVRYNDDIKMFRDNNDKYRIMHVQQEEITRKELLTEYMNKPIIRCPSCGSNKTARISTSSRVISVAAVGLASSKIGKTMECKACGHKW